MDLDLKKIKVLSFDCYGTLVDWEKGIVEVLRPWTKANSIKLSDDELLECFAREETVVQKNHPSWKYPQVLEEVAVRFAEDLGLEADESFQKKLAESVGNWPAFPDTVAALKELEKHFRLVILSNISEDSFQATNKNQLGIDFYKILTAEQIGTYKPDRHNFHYLIRSLAENGIQKEEILHVAQSLYHDMVPATDLGMNTVWINRRKNKKGFGATPAPSREVKTDLEFPSMGAFVNYVLSKFN